MTVAELAARVRAEPARLGAVRLVCVDGPAGSGKTTFAGRLADALGGRAALVHLDDLYAGWTLTGAQRPGCRPACCGRWPRAGPGRHHRYDWAVRRFSAGPGRRPGARGAGRRGLRQQPPGPRPVDDAAHLGRGARGRCGWPAAWPATARASSRSGGAGSATEAAEFAREGTRARADVRVDGAATADDGGLVPLP